jgi:hypothetical protein
MTKFLVSLFLFLMLTSGEGVGQTLTVPLPSGCVPTISGSTVTCTGIPGPSPTPGPTPGPTGKYAACAAAGYTARPYSATWPATGNTSGDSGQFGNNDAIVVSFTTPAAGHSAVFQPAGLAPNQGTMRVYTLSTLPCQFSGGLQTMTSQSPALRLSTGACPGPANLCALGLYGAFLQPNTTYYITMVNRGGVDGTPSCAASSCPMRMDFDHSN